METGSRFGNVILRVVTEYSNSYSTKFTADHHNMHVVNSSLSLSYCSGSSFDWTIMGGRPNSLNCKSLLQEAADLSTEIAKQIMCFVDSSFLGNFLLLVPILLLLWHP